MRRTLLPLVALSGLLLTGPARLSAQGYWPEEAARRMTTADGLTARLVAAEPLVRQPVAIEFDDRGRLWVIQYLQYPNPEGLRRVAVDRYSRTTYDRAPEPPPRGPKGSDRITILEDDDGDGRADRAKDFATGLNLASGLAFGRGGVFVLNVPYLLFYPDRDRDDVPDADPEVLLSGFGMEDAHSVANSLTWGPDGWLYGLQGSTVTARIRGVEFQQGVWRYHPATRAFELFAEGGGNMWGLDFDRHGRLFASTNVGGNVMLHMVRGGHYWKLFSKHGALHNPFAYGFFDHVPHEGVRGGHVAVGGLVYRADAWPAAFRDRYLAADLLDHSAHAHEVRPDGSSVRARQVGDWLQANDTWFAPSDMAIGPDGSVYVADWHDRRTAHPDPDADWDRSNGRVFAIDGPGTRRVAGLDLQKSTDRQLLELLDHPNDWYVRRARRILAERRDPETHAQLREAARKPDGRPRPLEALWTLAAAWDLDAGLMLDGLNHPDEHVRAWAVRLLGDGGVEDGGLAPRLVTLAEAEASAVVLSELAGTARRLPAERSIPILTAMLARDLDVDDPHLPLRLWWAVEPLSVGHATTLADRLIAPEVARQALFRLAILPRLIRRSAAAGRDDADRAASRHLRTEPTEGERTRRWEALEVGLRQRPADAPPVTGALKAPIVADWAAHRDDPLAIAVAARVGHRPAIDDALRLAAEPSASTGLRTAVIRTIAAFPGPPEAAALLPIALAEGPEEVAIAALEALGRSDDPAVAAELIAAYPSRAAPWKSKARDLLLARQGSTAAFLDAIDGGRIDPAEIPTDQVARIASLGDPAFDARVRARWGRLAAATPEERLAEVRRLNNDLRAGAGDPTTGRALFGKHCAGCHVLFGEGRAVGPELTHANRKDRDFLLIGLVDPSRVVRKEYQAVTVRTADGRVRTGLIVERTPEGLTLVDPSGDRQTVARPDVEEAAESAASLMPEDLYRRLGPQELRDLFAYLQADAPP